MALTLHQRYMLAILLTAIVAGISVYVVKPRSTHTTIPPTERVSAILVDQRDVDLKRDVPNGPLRPVRQTLAQPIPGASLPQAPAMDWLDLNVLNGRLQHWCFRGDAEANAIFKDALTYLASNPLFETDGKLDAVTGRTRPGVRWDSNCPGNQCTYTDASATIANCGEGYYLFDDNAAIQCGIGDDAVACAGQLTYCGRDTIKGDGWCSGHVSYTANYRNFTMSGGTQGKSPGLNAAGLSVALAHELQHIELNLGHNSCGRIIDPDTGKVVPSTMSGIILPGGPTCTDPGARYFSQEDWKQGVAYYGFAVRRTIQPTPTPVPTPIPDPNRVTGVAAQRWITNAEEPCTDPTGDGVWCITTNSTPGFLAPPNINPQTTTYYVLVLTHANGSLTFGNFQVLPR